MSKRSESFDLPTDQPNKVIEVKVRYSKHDGSYHDPRAESQGYWLNITPVEVDGMFRTTTAYTGVKAFLEPAKRFGAKKLADLLASVKHQVMTGHTDDRWPQLARRVADESGLRITQWDKAQQLADHAASFTAEDLADKE